MKRAVLYTRVSTEEQATEGYSLEAQRNELYRYAESKDMDIVGCYSDEGKSGKDIFREGLLNC